MLVNKSSLQLILSNVMRYVPNRTTLPILSYVHLQCKDGDLYVSGTNLSASYEARTQVGTEKFDICVPGKTLSDLLAKISDDAVSLSVDEKTLTLIVQYGRSKSKVKGMSGDEFPLTKESFKTQFFVSSNELREILPFALFSASNDNSHPILTGVKFQCENGILSLFAADGFRASIVQKETTLPNFTIVVPAINLSSLRLPEDEMLEFGIDDSVMMIKGSDFTFTTQLIDGNFPDVLRIVPKEYLNAVTVEAIFLQRAVEATMVFSRDVANIVKLVLWKDTVSVKGASSEIGDGENIVDLEASTFTEVGAFTIGVNGGYLLDVLRHSPTAMIEIHFNQTTNPIGFSYPGKNEFTHILMPMHVAG